MPVLTISIHDDYQEFLKEEVAAGKYKSPSEAVEALIIAEYLRKNQEQIDALLLEAEDEPDELLTDSAEFREERRLMLEEIIRSERAK